MSGSNGALLAGVGARAVVDDCAANGGTYREEVILDGRPTPHVEKPEPFRRHLDLLDGHSEEGRLP